MKRSALISAIILPCLLILVFLPTISFASDNLPLFWTTKEPLPVTRGQASVVSGDDGFIYLMGGWDGSDIKDNLYAFNPQTDTWTTKAAMLEATRGASSVKSSDGALYVISGYNSSSFYTRTVQTYNTTANAWAIKTQIPVPAWMATAAAGNNGKIYVFGGESPGLGASSNLTQVYDPVADTWINGTDMPTKRKAHTAVKGADGLIYVMGGSNDTMLFSAVEAYNPTTNTWHIKASMPVPKAEFAAVLGTDNKIYVIGGGANAWNNNSPFYNSVEAYDSTTNTWKQIPWSESLLPTARKEMGAAIGSNGKIYVIGGANGAYIGVNEEATIVPPENKPPTAYIDSISPNPATVGQSVLFVGHGSDPDGSIADYKWRSSIDGVISTGATLNTTSLSEGTHNIYFSVKDNSGTWSPEASATVIVNAPITEDPLYQKIQEANDELDDRIGALEQQNTNLTNTANNLIQKVDMLTMLLAGMSVVTIILVIVTIMLVIRGKPKPPPP